jgi:nucleotide-binding universal stress UspA family protein
MVEAARDREQDRPERAERPARKSVVVGVDGTETALWAVAWAAAEAELRDRPLCIVHAAPYAAGPSGAAGRRRARDILARAYTVARRRHPTVEARTERSDLDASAALPAAAEGADLLVLGMIGWEGAADMVIGSVAMEVSARASCPVVVVHGRQRSLGGSGAVVVGVASVALDSTVLSVAFADARRHRTPLVVVHAVRGAGRREHGGPDDPSRAELHELDEALEPWRTAYPDVPVQYRVVRTHATEALLAAAVTARLVVVGSRRGRRAPSLFGSTSREVLRHSPAPVEIVNPGAVDGVADVGRPGTAARTGGPARPGPEQQED